MGCALVTSSMSPASTTTSSGHGGKAVCHRVPTQGASAGQQGVRMDRERYEAPSQACQVNTPHGPLLQGQATAGGKTKPCIVPPAVPCCWLPSLLGSTRRHSKVRRGTRDQGSASKYRQKTWSLCSCVATGLAGAGDNSRNGSTGAEGALTETVDKGNRRERRTSWSRTPVHVPQMAARDRVASTAVLCMDHGRSSLGRHSGTSTAEIGSNNHYSALSPSTKTRQVSRVAVIKRKNCSGMRRSAAGSRPHICQQQYGKRQEGGSGP